MRIDTTEAWMIAALLVDAHGADAVSVAEDRAGRALGEGDYPSYVAWNAVTAAAEVYLRAGRSRNEIRQ
jgi:hypothetical protein